MPYNLKIEKKNDLLWITAAGSERTLEIVLSMARDILQACVENKVTLALLDVRPLKGLLKTVEAHDLPDKYFPKMRDSSVITRFVIVDRKESRENDRFFENVAVNRGFNLRIFSDSDKAVEWLLS
jgi:hypothetical protein